MDIEEKYNKCVTAMKFIKDIVVCSYDEIIEIQEIILQTLKEIGENDRT